MLEAGSDLAESTEVFSWSLRSSWDGREGMDVVVVSNAVERCESTVDVSLVGWVDDLALSGLGVEKELASLVCPARSDRELRTEPDRATGLVVADHSCALKPSEACG